jgi:hypothetical protein
LYKVGCSRLYKSYKFPTLLFVKAVGSKTKHPILKPSCCYPSFIWHKSDLRPCLLSKEIRIKCHHTTQWKGCSIGRNMLDRKQATTTHVRPCLRLTTASSPLESYCSRTWLIAGTHCSEPLLQLVYMSLFHEEARVQQARQSGKVRHKGKASSISAMCRSSPELLFR